MMCSHSNFNDKNFLSLIFTALHLRVQGSLSKLSVRLSNAWIVTK